MTCADRDLHGARRPCRDSRASRSARAGFRRRSRPGVSETLRAPQMSSQIGRPRRTPRKLTGPGSGPGLEHALLVEFAVVRQVDLVATAAILPPSGRSTCCGAPLFAPRRADDDARAAFGSAANASAAARQAPGRPASDQVLGRIAGEEQLGEHQEVGALRLRSARARAPWRDCRRCRRPPG